MKLAKMKTKIFLIPLFIITITSCSKEDEIPLTTRDSVVMDYNENYLGSDIVDTGWTGNTSSCNAGTVPQSTHDKVIKRINYFRRNDQTNHFPPDSWSCWTQDGYDGATKSNLVLSHSTTAIKIFIEDPGPGNFDVGHRRWILHSTKTQFSYGTTNKSMALGVIGVTEGNTQIPPYIAYPPNGFIPQELVFPRWSFSIPKADFSSADVTMSGPNGNISLDVVSRTLAHVGDNTIVWEPRGINTNSTNDVSYTIAVSGVTNAPESSYTYTATIIKP